jgi:Ca2+-binding EF-hand superfamily protein
VAREELQKVIEGQKVAELNMAEVSLLMKYADRGNKGYIAIDKFIEKLQELATETKGEQILKNFAMNCKRQQVNLRQEMMRFDTTRSGRLDKRTFAKAMNQLPVNLADDAVEHLFQAGETPESLGQLDIKAFIERVVSASKYTPLNTALLGTKVKKDAGSKPGSTPTANSQFESWEIEKKYKTKLQALQQQIEESKKETQAVEKQAKHW